MSQLVRVRSDKHPRYPWVAVWREGGRQRRKWFPSDREARAWKRQKEAELLRTAPNEEPITAEERRAVMLARERAVPLESAVRDWLQKEDVRARSISVAALIDERLEAVDREGRSKRYRDTLRARLRPLREAWGERLASDISPSDVAAWLFQRPDLAPRTIGHLRTMLHGLFVTAVDLGACVTNPVIRVRAPRVPRVGEIGILQVDQARHLLESADDILRPVIAIGLFAGLRRAEILQLDWEEVRLGRGFIEVRAAKAKTARRRLVTVQPALRRWLVEVPQRGPIWPANFERRFDDLLRRCGWRGKSAWVPADLRPENGRRPPWPHNALRHSFASYHLAHFQDAARTALELGHSDTRLLFEHYRELVTPQEAQQYWEISPHAQGLP